MQNVFKLIFFESFGLSAVYQDIKLKNLREEILVMLVI